MLKLNVVLVLFCLLLPPELVKPPKFKPTVLDRKESLVLLGESKRKWLNLMHLSNDLTKKHMTHYIEELKRIKAICFSNKIQLDIAIDTKRYIDTNFDKEINLDLLAHLRFTSKYHLIRVFKKYYGITPRQYLINKRIEKAKKILKTGKPVSDTCYSVGFQSINSFSNLFKAKTGMSPSIYRRATFDKSKK